MAEQTLHTTIGSVLNAENRSGILDRLTRLLTPSAPRPAAAHSVRARMHQARTSLDAAAAALGKEVEEKGVAI